MNPFYFAGCLLMLGAAAWSFWYGAPLSDGIAVCYAVANAFLAFVKS